MQMLTITDEQYNKLTAILDEENTYLNGDTPSTPNKLVGKLIEDYYETIRCMR